MFPIDLRSVPWKWIGVALLALGLAFAVVMYGNAREREGVAKTDAAWKAAAAKLEAESEAAAKKADQPAGQREADFAKRLEAEKEKINDAIARGGSPLDALFGVSEPNALADEARPVAP
jgi:hypothetical protein